MPVQVEVALMKGLAELRLMGLPDQALKESLLRVKSAIKNQGFSLPTAHKVLINLKPIDLKKGGRGLELAMALGVLMETGQVSFEEGKKVFAYGQLGLKGEVEFLDEVNWLPLPENSRVWSGYPAGHTAKKLKALSELSDAIVGPEFLEPTHIERLQRPEINELQFSNRLGRLLEVLAHGGHHALLAGPAGSGKSTAAYALRAVLPEPSRNQTKEIQRWNQYFQKDISEWRPLQAPHHSASAQAILGGGNPPSPGEVTRAHGGILLLDEFLEFQMRIREGLREPLERGEIQISRQGYSESLPAEFQLIATSNLCPCGDLVPQKLKPSCRYSKTKCQSYLERLSGPLADRFDILSFSLDWESKNETNQTEILLNVERAQAFQAKRKQEKPNGRLSWNELVSHVQRPFHLSYLPESGRSRRRHISILRVARSLADFDQCEKLELRHIKQAIELAWDPFQELKNPFL